MRRTSLPTLEGSLAVCAVIRLRLSLLFIALVVITISGAALIQATSAEVTQPAQASVRDHVHQGSRRSINGVSITPGQAPQARMGNFADRERRMSDAHRPQLRIPFPQATQPLIDPVPYRPVMPPLAAHEMYRAKSLIDKVCPLVNQTLYGPNGEAIPSLRVVAAGMGRSGSTWQFNAIIHILREAGIEPATAHGQVSRHYLELSLTLGCKYSVIKAHQFHPYFLEMADYVFTSHRDTRDSYASLVDLKAGFMFDHYWGEYKRWKPFTCIDMKYEDFYRDQLAEINRLIQTLPVPKSINATRVWELVEGARVAQKNADKRLPDWDAKTGYFKGHVQDPAPGRWLKLIGTNVTDDLFMVEQLSAGWLVANGYDLWFSTHQHNAKYPAYPPFPMSAHSPIPCPISHLPRCPLSNVTKPIGRDMPAPTDFSSQLEMWQQRRPTPPPLPAQAAHMNPEPPAIIRAHMAAQLQAERDLREATLRRQASDAQQMALGVQKP